MRNARGKGAKRSTDHRTIEMRKKEGNGDEEAGNCRDDEENDEDDFLRAKQSGKNGICCHAERAW